MVDADEQKKLFKLTSETLSPDDEIFLLKIKIINQIINNSLSKLQQNNIFQFDTCLAGGAVRDFLLKDKKQIKDLDFFICNVHSSHEDFDDSWTYKSTKREAKMNVEYSQNLKSGEYVIEYENVILSIKDKNLFSYENNNSNLPPANLIKHNQVLIFIITQELIKNNVEFVTKYIDRAEELGYLNSSLKGVVKVKIDDYHIDLIISDDNYYDFIMGKFDFNICKTYINNYSLSSSKTAKEIFQNITTTKQFLDDVKNRTLTYDITYIENCLFDNTMKNHFERLKKKYPDYDLKLVWDENQKIRISKEKIESTLVQQAKEKLDSSLPSSKKIKKSII